MTEALFHTERRDFYIRFVKTMQFCYVGQIFRSSIFKIIRLDYILKFYNNAKIFMKISAFMHITSL